MSLQYVSVESEYKKHKQLKKEDIQYLQEWLQKQLHLPPMTDLQLIFFLTSCNYSIEMTKITIDNYFTIRAICPEIFGKRELSVIKELNENSLVVPLRKLTNEGYLIVITSLRNCPPEKYVFADSLKYMDMILKLYFYENGTTEGLVVILDSETFTFGHMTKISIPLFKKFTIYLQEALPLKMRQIHFINASPATETFLKMVKPFINKKIYDMMHVHSGTMTTLYKYVPQECLPKDYGGNSKLTQDIRDEVVGVLMNNLDIIAEDEKAIADKSKRVEKSTRIESLFGMDGCFKQLDID